MKRNEKKQPLSLAEMDRTLGAEDGILPSSGFADQVMAVVGQQAAAPAPIPFPWKRMIPVVIAGAGAVVLLVIALMGTLPALLTAPAAGSGFGLVFGSQSGELATLARLALNPTAGWVAASLAVPVVCLLLMRRLIFSR